MAKQRAKRGISTYLWRFLVRVPAHKNWVIIFDERRIRWNHFDVFEGKYTRKVYPFWGKFRWEATKSKETCVTLEMIRGKQEELGPTHSQAKSTKSLKICCQILNHADRTSKKGFSSMLIVYTYSDGISLFNLINLSTVLYSNSPRKKKRLFHFFH